MTASDDYLLGALDAIEEVTERCKGLAYAHRAKGRLDSGHIEAMNDVTLVSRWC